MSLVLKGFVFVAVFLFGMILATARVSAQQSEIRQQILQPDCAGSRVCAMKAPTIRTIDKRGGQPLITGTYDVAFTKSLHVTLGGRVYILDTDSELTAQNDGWRLDLGALSPSLAAGEYELVVETIGYDNQVQRVRIIITLTREDVSPSTWPDDNTDTGEDDAPINEPEERPQPISKNTRESLISVVSLAAVLVISGASYIALAAIRRRRVADKKDVV